MIRTKDPIVYDAQTSAEGIVYLELLQFGNDCLTGKWIVAVRAYKEENGQMVELSTTIDNYESATFLAAFGTLTIQQIVDSIDQLTLQQVYANSTKFWGLVPDDLELVP